MLGIDEHSIHRGGTKGHMFAVTLAELRHHHVDKVFEGSCGTMPESSFGLLKGREKGKAVCTEAFPFDVLCGAFFQELI